MTKQAASVDFIIVATRLCVQPVQPMAEVAIVRFARLHHMVSSLHMTMQGLHGRTEHARAAKWQS